MSKHAYFGAEIFDGKVLHKSMVLLLDEGRFAGVIEESAPIPEGFQTRTLAGGTLMPGFVDLQVNGGGGVMFNDETTPEGVAAIARAHATTGTRALLPTLITDTPEKTRQAVDAVEAAIAMGVSGILGIHLEGPHLSIARKGAHDPSLIRPMSAADEAFLIEAARRLPNVLTTVAPENVTNDQIARLVKAGVIISLGHTDCSMQEAKDAFEAGATCVTHLFNAMSQLGNREPGLVGATLSTAGISCGLIADNIHVHANSMRVAQLAKQSTGGLFLVTDAMSTVGSDITEFFLNGRRVLRKDGRLTLENGTLAGADLDFSTAISVLIDKVGVRPAEAFAMATSGPAAVLNNKNGFGEFRANAPWNGIYLDASRRYRLLPTD